MEIQGLAHKPGGIIDVSRWRRRSCRTILTLTLSSYEEFSNDELMQL